MVERVQSLEDDRAIVDRIYETMHAIDDKRQADWLDCFTTDATFRFRWLGTTGWAFEISGVDQLREWIVAHGEDHPPGLEDHIVVNPRVTRIGDGTARVKSYFFAIRDTGSANPMIHATSRYDDTLVRCDDGAWRIAERSAFGEMPRHVD